MLVLPMATHDTPHLASDGRQEGLRYLFTSPREELVGDLVKGDLIPLLDGRGIAVEGTGQRYKGRLDGELLEFDLVAISRQEVVVVEVRTTLRSEDLTHFLSRLPRFIDVAHVYRSRRILGAVAYLNSDTSVTTYAERQGLFVIRATGSSATIINAEDFEPKAFG